MDRPNFVRLPKVIDAEYCKYETVVYLEILDPVCHLDKYKHAVEDTCELDIPQKLHIS